jgi:hypothetical protein
VPGDSEQSSKVEEEKILSLIFVIGGGRDQQLKL